MSSRGLSSGPKKKWWRSDKADSAAKHGVGVLDRLSKIKWLLNYIAPSLVEGKLIGPSLSQLRLELTVPEKDCRAVYHWRRKSWEVSKKMQLDRSGRQSKSSVRLMTKSPAQTAISGE